MLRLTLEFYSIYPRQTDFPSKAALKGLAHKVRLAQKVGRAIQMIVFLMWSSLIFAFAFLFVNQHNVAGFSSAFGNNHLAVGRPGETKNRLGRKIR